QRHVATEPYRSIGRCVQIVGVPAILDPLPHVPMQVVKPESVGRERANLSRLPSATQTANGKLRLALADRIAEGEACDGAGPRRVLPLGLAEQPVGLPGLARKPGDVLLRVVPGHADHRPPPAPPALIAWTVLAAAVRNTAVPLGERHLEFADREW